MTPRSLIGVRLLLIVWLTTMWVLLWGSVSPANVLTGLLAAAAVVWAFPPTRTNDHAFVVHPWPTISLFFWFLKALIMTNLAVAREVMTTNARSRIHTAIVAVELQTTSGRLATIIANMITLTPGTLTIDARGRPAVLYVHVLTFASVEATRDEVADLERRVVRAFGTADEVARICGPGTDPRTATTEATNA